MDMMEVDGRANKIANLVRDCDAANIPVTVEVGRFIEEYFVDDVEEDDEVSSTEDSTDDELPPPPVSLDLTESDEEDADVPLVRAADVCCEEDGCPAPNQQQAAAYSCGCTLKVVGGDGGDRRGCIAQFTAEEILACQLSLMDMDRDDIDMFIMGVLSSQMNTSALTQKSRRKEQQPRQRTRTDYCIFGHLVCRKAFLFMTCISDKRLRNVMAHYKANGLCRREDKRGGRKSNTRALTPADTNNLYRFILNFAEEHGVQLPGRVPGFHRSDITLLPSSWPKSKIHREYLACAQLFGFRGVAISTFRSIWEQLLPFVVVSRPMTDLCWVCQRNMHHIYRSANLNDAEKLALLEAQTTHLSRVDEERREYRRMVADSKQVVEQLDIHELETNPPCTREIRMHYSFDFAQQVHLPHSPYQPGPLFFLTPRKVGIFGVCAEGLPQQVNYLIDEAASSSKGSNAVISYVHHFFSHYSLGETMCDLHCDNCSGQNKNKFMLWYCAWRVMTARHQTISLNFMPPGHTKFAPDWCFGLLKRLFRRSEVHCLEDLRTVVEESTPVKHINKAQIVKSEAEDAQPEVVTYDWQTFFQNERRFRTLKGIKKIGHFRFSADRPGYMFYRETLADQETEFQIVPNVEDTLGELPDFPPVIPPPGLSRERQAYLFHSIRPFVRDGAKDILTPEPV